MTFEEWLGDAAGEQARLWLNRIQLDIDKRLAELYLEQAFVGGRISALTEELEKLDAN